MVVSKWSVYDSEILKLLPTITSDAKIAQTLLNTSESTHVNPDVNLLRTYVKRFRAKADIGVINTCDSTGVNPENVKMYWDKRNPGLSTLVINPHYKAPTENEVPELDFTSIFSSLQPVKYELQEIKEEALFDRLVYTDVHVAMHIKEHSIYGGEWNEDVLFERLGIMVNHVLSNRKSDDLLIHDLGDFVDGYDAKTVRRDHDLPQNMDNQKAFDTAVQFKIDLIRALKPYYRTITCHNVTDDNHGGSFTYIVNSAVRTALSYMYPEGVTIVNQRQFIDHHVHKGYPFILCHGKDAKEMKNGLKPILTPDVEKKIDAYINHNYLIQPNHRKIEFAKGDSHQYIFDKSTSLNFDYCNYPALSPASTWVQTNFGKSTSGIVFYNYYENRKVVHDYLFEWNNKKIA